MNARLQFQKALRLLDAGRCEDGESCLRSAIEQADGEGADVTKIAARVALGDYLHQSSRSAEAKPLLEQALSLNHDAMLDDVLDEELKIARQILDEISNS